jgi:hypothetical protein
MDVDPEFKGTHHTQLGIRESKRGDYLQGREFDEAGNPVRLVECTDHRRKDHPKPHQHAYTPNPTGGTYKRGSAEPIVEERNELSPRNR